MIMTLPFVVDEINQQHKQAMIDKFIHDRIENNQTFRGNNTSYDDTEYTSIISNKFLNLIKDNFDNLGDQINEVELWIYVQNNIHHRTGWHNHATTSTINAVYYIDPPKDGGEIQFFYPRGDEKELTVKPEVDKIYIWPYWLYHRVLPQKDSSWRISVNLEYYCQTRPTIKNQNLLYDLLMANTYLHYSSNMI